MATRKTQIGWVPEAIKHAFGKLFQREHIRPEFYRVYVGSSVVPDKYNVILVWDGFEPMSVTARQVWLWKRTRKAVPKAVRQTLGNVSAYSVKEVVVADELSLQEHASSVY